MVDWLLLVLGGVALYLGAEWLVAGASGVALSLHVSPLVVGLTVVAYGTSMPEAIVGVQASRTGNGAIALNNVIGSNIANLGLILGVGAVIRQVPVDGTLRSRELPVFLISALALPLLLIDHRISAIESLGLVLAALGYSLWMLHAAKQSQTPPPSDASTAPRRLLPQLGKAAVGLVVLLVGGHLFVRGATGIALAFGLSERIVGLTIVALGTSLPELVTTVVASIRGQAQIAVGNVVGSNIFNILFCLGCAGMVRPIGGASGGAVDLGVMVGLTLFACLSLGTKRVMRRWEGALLLGIYATYVASLFVWNR